MCFGLVQLWRSFVSALYVLAVLLEHVIHPTYHGCSQVTCAVVYSVVLISQATMLLLNKCPCCSIRSEGSERQGSERQGSGRQAFRLGSAERHMEIGVQQCLLLRQHWRSPARPTCRLAACSPRPGLHFTFLLRVSLFCHNYHSRTITTEKHFCGHAAALSTHSR